MEQTIKSIERRIDHTNCCICTISRILYYKRHTLYGKNKLKPACTYTHTHMERMYRLLSRASPGWLPSKVCDEAMASWEPSLL